MIREYFTPIRQFCRVPRISRSNRLVVYYFESHIACMFTRCAFIQTCPILFGVACKCFVCSVIVLSVYSSLWYIKTEHGYMHACTFKLTSIITKLLLTSFYMFWPFWVLAEYLALIQPQYTKYCLSCHQERLNQLTLMVVYRVHSL